MTLLWLAIPILVAIALLYLASRGLALGRGEKESDELAVYQDQLREAQSQHEQGLISDDEFAELRPEIARRAIAAAEGSERQAGGLLPASQTWPVLIAGALAVFLAVGGYIYLGSPSTPSAAPREEAGDPAFAHDGEFSNLVERLAVRLEKEPGDIEGWRVYALTMAQLGRNSEAANRLGEVAEALPDEIELKVLQAEALVRVAEGIVVPAARHIFNQILDVAPDHPAGHYYLGLALFQDGNAESAYRVWTNLRARSEEGAPWLANLDMQIERARASLGVSAPEGSGAPALDEGQMAAVAQMTPEERRSFIESMIAGLRARLESEPSDIDGWMRLARAESVMGRQGRAIEALDRALQAAPDERRAEIEAMRESLMAESR